MKKFIFEKCLSSHGVFLICKNWRNDLLAAFYPLYNEFKLYDKSYTELRGIMMAHHFDHQFDEVARFRQMCEFKRNKRRL